MRDLYFIDPAYQGETEYPLSREHRHYFSKVLRVSAGATLILLDGRGGRFAGYWDEGHLRSVHRLAQDPAATHPIHLYACLLKGDAWDWVIQKATELGAMSLTPVLSEYTVVKWKSEKAEAKQQHWQAIADHACTQCTRSWRMVIHPALNLTSYRAQHRVWVADPHGSLCIQQALTEEIAPGPTDVWIGPEGGFSASERVFFEAQNAQIMRLGPRILRADTAPVVLLSLLQASWEAW